MAPEESEETSVLLQNFERRFLAARALRSFPWQSLEEKLRHSGSELLLDVLQKTVKHPLCVKHPPSVKYARCFLSELIRKPSGDSVTLSESTAIISHGTTGLVTWNAALYLAEWALENTAAFTHRTVLELGSGAGLTGLVICKMCRPRAYVFSDCHSHVLEQLQGNILLNGFLLEPDATAPAQHTGRNTHTSESPVVTVEQLDWDDVTAPRLAALRPDIILAADVLYCPEIILSLVRVLQRLSACRKDEQALDAYIAFTIRNPETCQLFTTELAATSTERWNRTCLVGNTQENRCCCYWVQHPVNGRTRGNFREGGGARHLQP
ncbi:protein-lysine N-methyltransferase EEF2KMT isoform X4 [Sturnira hondurensis]|uniref:protein-lysine N-methyltransferase EEF2KMT isoform X4 n=1 Tax=Sturnira hondurensis TaxID=192404 RepID=UPI00187A4A2E|nr:protein-lysine N-methyltransferase EEF2KMT isoform X4 [Sturnira hondurensis]